MATTQNTRSLYLANANPRLLASPNTDILLTASSPIFHVGIGGNAVNTNAIIFTATPIAMAGAVTYSFTITGGAFSSVSGNTAILNFSDMTADVATVSVSVAYRDNVYTRSTEVSKLFDAETSDANYIWIRYADGANGEGISNSPEGKTYIGLAYNKNTATESTDPADYIWSLIKGTDGQPGLDGLDGQTLYTWIKYSDNADGTNMYDLPGASTMYIGLAANKTTSVEGTDKTDYTWSKFRGDDGVSVPGSRGAGFYRVAGGAWDDNTANNATPGGNVTGDIVTISNGTVSYTKEWDGTAWFVPGAFLSGNLFVERSITAAQINANGLELRKPDGTLILSAGGLQEGFEAPGTKNSDLSGAISSAATTANANSITGMNHFRVLTYGLNGGGPVPAGHYGLSKNGVGVADPGFTYRLVIIRRSDGAITWDKAYPILTNPAAAGDLALDLNNTDAAHILVVYTYDEPQGNRLGYGLPAAMYRCGASRSVFGSSEFKFRAAYCLIGIGGCGEGNGAEFYQGSIDYDPNAWVDVAFTLTNGNYTVSGQYTPRSLRDYAFTGDYDSTRGAPAGTSVGNREAQLVSDYAYAGQLSYNALPDINTAIADKLSKAAGGILQGAIAVQTTGGIGIGSLTWNSAGNRNGGHGVGITSYGIAAYNSGGVPTFTLDASTGNATFAGQLSAAYGTLGSMSIAPGGFIAQGFNGTWNWSNKSPGPGFLIHQNGMLFGDMNDSNYGFVQINATGEMSMPGFSYAGRQLTLDNAIIVNPDIRQAVLTINGVANINGGSGLPNNSTSWRVYGSFTVSAVNGADPYSFVISLNTYEGQLKMNISGSTVTISGRGVDITNIGAVNVIVTDAKGRSTSKNANVFGSHGTVQ